MSEREYWKSAITGQFITEEEAMEDTDTSYLVTRTALTRIAEAYEAGYEAGRDDALQEVTEE